MAPIESHEYERNVLPATHALVPVRWLEKLLEVYYSRPQDAVRETQTQPIPLEAPSAIRVSDEELELIQTPVPAGYVPRGVLMQPEDDPKVDEDA